MAKAIRFHETGGPEVLELETVEVGEPGPGQARVRHTYVAVNFIDIYFRTGRYPLALPEGVGSGLGSDAVGVVEAVGDGVTDIKPGDRVGYLLGPQGAYADVRVMPAEVLIPLPDGVSDRTASTLMMKGMTAQYRSARSIRCTAVRRSCTTPPRAVSAWWPANGHARSA